MTRSRAALGCALMVLGVCAFTQACIRGVEYEVRGLVLSVDAARRTMTISHDAIAGFMDPMVMPFAVAPGATLDGVRPGDRVAFRLVVGPEETMIRDVRILSAAPAQTSLNTGALASVPIGSVVADFTLVDQDGRPVSLSSFRGKVVVAGFIYTRCPLPDYCPRVMTTLGALRDRFSRDRAEELVLLTVTFDPKYDTPERLRAFGEQYGAGGAGWRLLTGSPEEIERVCAAFGVEYYADAGMITHSLQTVVIDREGRLAATVEGKEFSTRQLGDLVEAQMRSER